MHNALEEDRKHRAELAELYSCARSQLNQLPKSRQAELNQQVTNYAEGLNTNLEKVRKSDCAILIAGKASMMMFMAELHVHLYEAYPI